MSSLVSSIGDSMALNYTKLSFLLVGLVILLAFTWTQPRALDGWAEYEADYIDPPVEEPPIIEASYCIDVNDDGILDVVIGDYVERCVYDCAYDSAGNPYCGTAVEDPVELLEPPATKCCGTSICSSTYPFYPLHECSPQSCIETDTGAECTEELLPPPAQCEDSDGGIDLHTKGTTGYEYEGNPHVDYCQDAYVMEGSCPEGTPSVNPTVCPTGETCNGGVCVSTSVCVESDAGLDPETPGVTTKGSTRGVDYCFTKDGKYWYVEEYMCEALSGGDKWVTHYPRRCSGEMIDGKWRKGICLETVIDGVSIGYCDIEMPLEEPEVVPIDPTDPEATVWSTFVDFFFYS